jgi:hypothetical protein
MVWTQIKINRAFFVLVFVVDFFGVFFFGGWGGSSIARGGGPPGWHLWTCCISLYRKMSGSLLKLKDLFIFRVTLNIFYCSILNNRIGHKFYNLETSSPIHTWINTTWTYIILYIFHIQWRHKNKIPPNVKRHANGLSKQKSSSSSSRQKNTLYWVLTLRACSFCTVKSKSYIQLKTEWTYLHLG